MCPGYDGNALPVVFAFVFVYYRLLNSKAAAAAGTAARMSVCIRPGPLGLWQPSRAQNQAYGATSRRLVCQPNFGEDKPKRVESKPNSDEDNPKSDENKPKQRSIVIDRHR